MENTGTTSGKEKEERSDRVESITGEGVDKTNIPNKTGPAWARMACLNFRALRLWLGVRSRRAW